jgi:hypothetical protein
MLVAAFAATIMLPLCAISVDASRWYVEVSRVQNAADAAATAGVTYLPDDFASAKATAIAVAERNGYPNSGKSSVSVAVGEKPTQLKVTIDSNIGNAFGASFGVDSATIERSATADFNGPAPMGSPCNAFGNEPAGAVSDATDPIRGPNTSVIVAPPGGAVCTSTPQFWGAIAGPNTDKQSGDQYMTRGCSTADGCTGSVNNEFDPRGYFYIVRVAAAAVNKAVTLQIYDPAWIENGDTCTTGPLASAKPNAIPFRNNMSTYTPTDGIARYNPSPNEFCTGDTLGGGTTPITTSYGLRAPTDTYNPSNGAPITSCERQYAGVLQSTENNTTPANVSTGTLAQYLAKSGNTSQPDTTKPNSKYNVELAKVYHQWVALCTFTPTQVGDYYLQIRTNVKLGGVSDGQGGYMNNDKVFTQSGDDTSVGGNGNNRFAIRVKGAGASGVSVSGYQHMSIYANYTGANTTFNMVRVIPAAATKPLKIVFFDVGDASQAGSIQVLPPTDSNLGSTVTGCTGAGVANGALTNCTLTNVSSATYQGKQQVISVPIPSSYTCNATQAGGCWYRLLVKFPGGVTDTTTWSASIDGDPIRLIK